MDSADNNWTCLNCGAKISEGIYCPYCGQSKTVGRITMRYFWVDIVCGLTRINKGVFYTCTKLLIQPWNVINDYIKGKRQKYTGPIQILVVICFITLALMSILGVKEDSSSTKIIIDDNNYLGQWFITAVQWYVASPIIQSLTLFIPAVPAFMLIANQRDKTCRYNLAESLLAAIYTSSSILLFRLIVEPIEILFNYDTTFLSIIYVIIIGCIGLSKALGYQRLSNLKLILNIGTFFCLCVFIYLILFVAMTSFTYWTIIK